MYWLVGYKLIIRWGIGLIGSMKPCGTSCDRIAFWRLWESPRTGRRHRLCLNRVGLLLPVDVLRGDGIDRFRSTGRAHKDMAVPAVHRNSHGHHLSHPGFLEVGRRFPRFSIRLPRLRGFHGRSLRGRLGRTRRCDLPRGKDGQVQGRKGYAVPGFKHAACDLGDVHPLDRLVRFQWRLPACHWAASGIGASAGSSPTRTCGDFGSIGRDGDHRNSSTGRMI